MYEYIKGEYMGLNKDYVVIDNGGLGYKVYTSGSTISKLPKLNEDILLYIQQIVREDFIGLYGFLTKEELSMFNLLLTISGVGAKASLSLLSICTVNNLKYAILTGDEKTITKAPGIGKKMAQRIILELKDKISPEGFELGENKDQSLHNGEVYSNAGEACEALIALGYTEKEVEKALKEIDKADTVENIIKNALRVLMN
jgi:holliday junction DNA helicase RuvA